MKNKRFGFLAILAFAALASSCGTSYYTTSMYDDGIYYRPTKDSRARMIAAQEALREKEEMRRYDQYLARDEQGNLYVVTELMDGETYESRLRKFDSPWYTPGVWYGNSWTWGYAWLDSYYGWGYPYHYHYSWGHPYYYGRYNPYYGWGYYDPWYWGIGSYAGWYGYNYWNRHHYPHYWWSGGHGHVPGSGSRRSNSVVYTPRNIANGSGMYRTTGPASGSRGMYSAPRRSDSGGTVTTRSTASGSSAVRSSGSRPVRTGASGSSSGSYTRSTGGYSGGSSSGGFSGGGSRSSGGSSSGGSSVSGGNHSGGGRR